MQIVIHDIKKVNKVQNNIYEITDEDIENVFYLIKPEKILKKQNELSKDMQNGMIWVLNMSVFMVADYNFSLITQ